MKAVLRIAWLNFTWSPVFRWLFVIGMALAVVGGLAAPELAVAAVMLGTCLALIAPAFAGSMMLRQVAATRQSQLWPRGRALLLLGSAATLLAGSALAAAASAWLHYRAPGLAILALARVFTVTASGGALLWILQYSLAGSRYSSLAFIGLMYGLRALAPMLPSGVDVVPALAALAAVACAVFAAYFLRSAPAVLKPGQGSVAAALGDWMERRSSRPTTGRAAALRLVLLQVRTPWSVALQGLVMITVVQAFILAGSNPVPPTVWSVPMLYLMALQFGQMAGRRARALWLVAPGGRDALYLEARRTALPVLGVFALPLLLGTLAVALWRGAAPQVVVPQLLAHAAFAAALVPVGLWMVRGKNWLDVTTLVVLTAGWGVLATLTWRSDAAIAASIALAGLLALAFGALGRRRWRAVDWMTFRPVGLAGGIARR